MSGAPEPPSAVDGLDLPAAAVVVADGIVVALNDRAKALVPGAAIGDRWRDWFAADEGTIATAALAGPAPEVVLTRRDRDRWVAAAPGAADPDGRRLVLLRDATDDQFVRAAVDAVADSTFVIEGSGANRWRSARLRERSGIPDAEAARQLPGERIHPEDLPLVFEAFAAVTPERPLTVQARSRSVDDDDRWETIAIMVWNRLRDRVLSGFLVQVHNLDEGRPLKTALSEADPQLLSLTEAAPVGILVTDPAGQIVYRNPVARSLLGPRLRSFGDADWLTLAAAEHRDALAAWLSGGLREQREGSVTASFVDEDGTTRWLRLRVVPQRADGADRTKGVIATVEDVTEQVEAQAQLEATQAQLRHLATHDGLTGLPNRAALTEELGRAVARHERSGEGLAVLFCDLDGFKPVNDQRGHAGGDVVLSEIAVRLGRAVSAGHFVARLGGDEFVVLCERAGPGDGEVRTLADRLHAEVAQPFALDPDLPQIGLSIGVAHLGPGKVSSADALLLLADQAMYEAKAAGGRRTTVHQVP